MAAVPGRYLIIDLQAEPPGVVNTDDVLPQVILDALSAIDAKLGILMTNSAGEQQQLTDIASAISTVADHVNTAATAWQAYMDAHPELDFSPVQSAMDSLNAADATLSALVPQAPPAPLPTPIPDPGPPVDTTTGNGGSATDTTTTPAGNGGSTDVPVTDAGGATSGLGVDTGAPPPDANPPLS